jgi:hypothetical protein
VPEDAGIKPRTAATLALAVRRANHSATVDVILRRQILLWLAQLISGEALAGCSAKITALGSLNRVTEGFSKLVSDFSKKEAKSLSSIFSSTKKPRAHLQKYLFIIISLQKIFIS